MSIINTVMERSVRRDAAEAAESGKEETAADFRRTYSRVYFARRQLMQVSK